jgi:hypothetical protein
MDTSFFKLKTKLAAALTMAFVVSLPAMQLVAQCSAPTLKFHSPVLLSGSDGQQGAIYLFRNVIPGADAHIEIAGIYGGATLYNIDDSTGIGYYDAFQPYVGAAANSTSYIDWKITFKAAGTNTDTMLSCLAVTGVDVDGDGTYLQEFIEAATPGSIAVDPYSILHVSFDGVRSKAVSTIRNIPRIDTARTEAMFQMNFTNISTLLYRNGAISTYGAQQIRQTCIYFAPFFPFYSLLATKITSFAAKPEGDFTKLIWSASDDNNIKSYIVQKSGDRKIWEDIQVIVPQSSTTKNNYSFIDKEQNNRTTYYRLKEISTIGSINYSKIIQVNKTTSPQNSISHNTLVQSMLNFQINGTANDEFCVELFTMTGTKIKQAKFLIQPGITYKSMEVASQLTPGFYFLIVKNSRGEQIHSSRLIKN